MGRSRRRERERSGADERDRQREGHDRRRDRHRLQPAQVQLKSDATQGVVCIVLYPPNYCESEIVWAACIRTSPMPMPPTNDSAQTDTTATVVRAAAMPGVPGE